MIKHNEKHLERVIDNLNLVKEYSSKLTDLQSPNRDTFWGGLKKIINKSMASQTELIISALDQDILDEPGVQLSRLKYRAGCINAYKEVLMLVDKNEEACSEAASRIKELTEKVEAIRTNIEAQ